MYEPQHEHGGPTKRRSWSSSVVALAAEPLNLSQGPGGRKAPPGVGVVSVVVRQLAALHSRLLPCLMHLQTCVGPRRAILQCIVCGC